jgi:hypothetical protein
MRILHIADVHLDRPLVGTEVEAARLRRAWLRSGVGRCLEIARSCDVVGTVRAIDDGSSATETSDPAALPVVRTG